MQMNDSQRIPASREKVWAALNDPLVLKQCIPGCQNLEMSSPTEMTATVVFKVGPVKATFGGKVTLVGSRSAEQLSDLGRGIRRRSRFCQGRRRRAAGIRKPRRHDPALRGGRADRRQAGAARRRLIDSTARKLAGEFFAAFGEAVGGTAQAPVEAPAEAEGGKKSWIGTADRREVNSRMAVIAYAVRIKEVGVARDWRAMPTPQKLSPDRPARKTEFSEPIQRDSTCPVRLAKIFPLRRQPKSLPYLRRPVPQRGVSRSSRTWGGMRWTRMALLTRAPEADGEVVWF